MRNPNPIEEIYADLIMLKDLRAGDHRFDDPELIAALDKKAGDDFSVEIDRVWGNTVDIVEFEDCQLTIKTERSLSYYAAS